MRGMIRMPNHVEHDLHIYEYDENDGVMEAFHKYWIQMMENAKIREEKLRGFQIKNWQRKRNGLPELPEPEVPISISMDLIPLTDLKWSCGGALKQWGSKWGMYELECEEENELYAFETAWGPSFPLYLKLAEKFPTLNFTICYFEGGMEFSGRSEYKNGKCISKEEAPYFGRRGG